MSVAVHEPLRTPEADASRWVPPLDIALDRARETLAEQQAANIHDDRAMLSAAVSLEIVLANLLAALDKEAGR
ncbi:hypothetical protein ACFV0H_07555 [Streptomyces erythrochromogenes]|uniref:hypothetical protein n=1 Tax=Streptomyces erythrochromogenes TaxID=285574 RepID=UPI00368B1AAA